MTNPDAGLIDYRRLDYRYAAHHARYKNYVESNGLMCQDCGGHGEYVAERFEFGPRYESCGWCEGTGKVTRWLRGEWLKYKREAK